MWISGSVEGANGHIIIMRCLVRIPVGIVGMQRIYYFFHQEVYTYLHLLYFALHQLHLQLRGSSNYPEN
jgi:hypothetical protein